MGANGTTLDPDGSKTWVLMVENGTKVVNDRNGQNQFRPKPKFRPSWPKVRPKFRPKKYQKLRENGGSFSIRKFFLRLGLLLNEIQIAWGNHFIFILLLAYEIIILLRELEKIAKNVNKLTWNLPKNSSKWRFLPFRYFGGFTERFGRNISANSTEISAEISVSVVHYQVLTPNLILRGPPFAGIYCIKKYYFSLLSMTNNHKSINYK